MVELREARRAAARIGLGLQYVLKEARVFHILSKLSPVILSERVRAKAIIVFKGGTALNKIYLHGVQRFSEDLDFDAFFAEELTRGEKIAFIEGNIVSPLRGDYEIPKPRMMREVLRFTCTFENEVGMKDSVFIEFNLEPKKVGETELKEARSEILGTPSTKVPVYTFQTLIAKKIKTFYERESGKDLYDIYHSLKIPINLKDVATLLKEVLEAEGINYETFAREFLGKLEDERKIARMHASSNPYIPRKLRVDWVTSAREVKEKLSPLLTPSIYQKKNS